MWELRWVLLGLGALIVIGVYLWGGLFSRASTLRLRRAERREPRLSVPSLDPEPEPENAEPAPIEEWPVEAEPAPAEPPSPPERVIALRLVPQAGSLDGEAVVKALREADLKHGRYDIFHRLDTGSTEPVFSVASLTEPGTFDLDNLEGTTLAGVTIFMVLPGVGDPVSRFDAMVLTARSLAVTLAGELYDERGSSWSVQRERYVREEVIEYRHQLERY